MGNAQPNKERWLGPVPAVGPPWQATVGAFALRQRVAPELEPMISAALPSIAIRKTGLPGVDLLDFGLSTGVAARLQ
ncbi:hypothetical protein GCM10027175_39780 [Hymenobacter latericoloratus]